MGAWASNTQREIPCKNPPPGPSLATFLLLVLAALLVVVVAAVPAGAKPATKGFDQFGYNYGARRSTGRPMAWIERWTARSGGMQPTQTTTWS